MATLTFEPYADTDAICNDGTASGLYFQKATKDSQKDVWVVQVNLVLFISSSTLSLTLKLNPTSIITRCKAADGAGTNYLVQSERAI